MFRTGDPGAFGCAVVAASLLSTSASAGDTLHVPSVYPTIQDALWAAHHEDEIVVADGTYGGPGFRDLEFGGLRITLRSASGDPNLCALDCQMNSRAFVFDNDENEESILEGFTIVNGLALDNGGAIYIGDASPTIRNCIIRDCLAESDGGAVYIGGASSSPASFTDCTFLNNLAIGDGGGVFVSNGSPSFVDCAFEGNEAFDDGGGLYAWQSAPAITGCDFDGNEALDQGGAIRNVTEDDCTISTTCFTGNTAKDGGAIYHARAGVAPTMTLDGCTFTSNSTPATMTGRGGAIYVTEAALVVDDGAFDGNSATGNGGAVYVEGWLTATGTDFMWNSTADSGGAIFASTAGVVLIGCTLDHNDAMSTDQGGGALHCSETELTMIACTLQFNTAQRHGGAIYNSDGEATLSACTLAHNSTAVDVDDSDGGGAITSTFYSTLLTMNGCTFSENVSVTGGGAILIKDESSAVIQDCEFIENTSQGNGGGGAIRVAGAFSTASISKSTFRGNDATANSPRGGAVSGAFPIIADCLFISNSSGWRGGAVYASYIAGSNVSPLIINSRFFGNHAERGGALTAQLSCDVVGCTFSHNWADNTGGALNVMDDLVGCRIVNSTFWSNTAGIGDGGAIDGDSFGYGWVDMSNSILWDNAPGHFGFYLTAAVDHCDVEGGETGTGNIDIDPLFIDPDGPDDVPGTEDDNLRLAPLSPCIDAADNAAVPPDTPDLDGDGDVTEPVPFDLDGEDRFVDDPATTDTGSGTPPIIDMGAYEFQTCPADINNDDVVDVDDLLLLLAAWGGATGPADVNHDGIVDVSDLLVLLGTWGPCP